MPLTPEQREKLLETSRPAAEALLEDLQYLRQVVKQDSHTRAEVRRLSSLLRRILVERDLELVASPRVGKIKLTTPDNSKAYKVLTPENCDYYSSGGMVGFGLAMRFWGPMHPSIEFTQEDAERTLQLPLDNFLAQKVIYWRGEWLSRKAVIKYVANVLSGVHSKAADRREYLLLEEVSHRTHMGHHINDSGERGVAISGTTLDMAADKKPTYFDGSSLNLVLMEMFAAAGYLTDSPAVDALEAVIKTELAA